MKKVLLSVWIIIILITSFNYELIAMSNQEHETDKVTSNDQKQDDKSSQEVVYFQLDKTFTSIHQIDFHADFNFEFEFPFILDNTNYTRTHDQKEEKEYFKTLFHFIISPNAP